MAAEAHKIVRSPSTGIDVVVVGAGIGGLFSAVELYRQGHTVRVLESKPELTTIGEHRSTHTYTSKDTSR